MKRKKQKQKKDITRIEWLGIMLIFVIGLVTGYFYTIQRLQPIENDVGYEKSVYENSLMDDIE